MMRPKYYLRLFGQMNVKKSFVLFLIFFVIFIILSIIFLKKVAPIIKVACDSTAKSIGVKITEETVGELIQDVKYETLMNLTYNREGKIIAISANIVELNKLSSQIAYKIQEKLNNLGKVTIKVPMGEILGLSIFSGYGPDINIKLVPMGNIETKFNSEFKAEGINQTKHTIYMNINCIVTVVAPFIGDTVTCNSTLTIAETIIIGEIPGTYYNIQGIEGANKSGALEIMGD